MCDQCNERLAEQAASSAMAMHTHGDAGESASDRVVEGKEDVFAFSCASRKACKI